MNESYFILIKVLLKFVPKDLIDYNSAYGQVMAWPRQVASHYLNQC